MRVREVGRFKWLVLPLLALSACLQAQAGKSWGLNGPWADPAAAPQRIHNRSIDMVTMMGGSIYRFPIMTDLAFLRDPQVMVPEARSLHEFIARKCARNRLQVNLILTSGVPNTTLWRKLYYDESRRKGSLPANLQNWPAANDYLWKNWQNVSHDRLNIDQIFWPQLIRNSNQIIAIYEQVYRQEGLRWQDFGTIELFNEIGWVQDADFSKNPQIPYGTIAPWVTQFYDQAVSSGNGIQSFGAPIVGGALENQNRDGVLREMMTNQGRYTTKIRLENVHLYVPYTPGESIFRWADRLVSSFDQFVQTWDSRLPNRRNVSFAVTEFGSANLPKDQRALWLVTGARKLLLHPRCSTAVGYTTTTRGQHGDLFGIFPWEGK